MKNLLVITTVISLISISGCASLEQANKTELEFSPETNEITQPNGIVVTIQSDYVEAGNYNNGYNSVKNKDDGYSRIKGDAFLLTKDGDTTSNIYIRKDVVSGNSYWIEKGNLLKRSERDNSMINVDGKRFYINERVDGDKRWDEVFNVNGKVRYTYGVYTTKDSTLRITDLISITPTN